MPEPQVKIVVVESDTPCGCLICPHCGAHELVDCHKKDEPGFWDNVRFNIKAFRVDNQSHCLVCDSWF